MEIKFQQKQRSRWPWIISNNYELSLKIVYVDQFSKYA